MPNTTQMRALAYAQKPFAALSFFSSLFVVHYLLVRRPERRKRIYHRIILSIFICIMPLSFCLFLGTWAMPAGSAPWAVGASGTSVTCSIQGFLIMVFYLAFPFYYASISVVANVAMKNNFQEEKYAWIEKWIHIGAYLPSVTISIIFAARGWIKPTLATCTANVSTDCPRGDIDPNCDKDLAFKAITPIAILILIELMVGTLTIIKLLCTFDKVQKKEEVAIGMQKIVEKARKERFKTVSLQSGLYLTSFWFGYVPLIVEFIWRRSTGIVNYELIVISHCIFAFQGFFVMAIYFVLLPRRDALLPQYLPEGHEQETVSKIRANAARRRSSSHPSSLPSRFSFSIFDGTPAEDSPWRCYLDGDGTDDGLTSTVIGEEESVQRETIGLTVNLSDSPLGESASRALLAE